MAAVLQPSRTLLIAPQFFGYEKEIALELTRSGQMVDFLPDRPFKSSFMKAVMRFRPELGGYQSSDHFFATRINALSHNDYTNILIIQGEGVTPNTLRVLRSTYPRANLIFYTWDSMRNKPLAKRSLSLYDRGFTFDPLDAHTYGMSFRPLFYLEGFDRGENAGFDYDISFIGTVHSDRYKIVKALLHQLPQDARAFVYLYMQAPWVYDFRRLFTNSIAGSRRNEFQYTPLSHSEVQAIAFGSSAILDIEHAGQRGATMRTIEALGSMRKIITTNASLSEYDFYNPLNIRIIDRHAPFVDPEFLFTPYQAVPENVRQKYSLSSWVRDIFNCGELKSLQ